MKSIVVLYYKLSFIEFLKYNFIDTLQKIAMKIGINISLYKIKIPGYSLFCYLRPNTSDRDVFKQIFIDNQYQYLTTDITPKIIIDCGAYVGFSSIYFALKFKNAHIIAIEPDENNYSLLEKNTSFCNRIAPMQTAIWPYNTALKIIKGQYRDGKEWTTQVRECNINENKDIDSVSINYLLDKYSYSSIDILKIDIERAEIELFKNNYQDWILKVKQLIIELHDDECTQVFFSAMDIIPLKFNLKKYGELTIVQQL